MVQGNTDTVNSGFTGNVVGFTGTNDIAQVSNGQIVTNTTSAGSLTIQGSGDSRITIAGSTQSYPALTEQTVSDIDAIDEAVLDRDAGSADLVSAQIVLADGGGLSGVMSAVANSAESLADMTSTYAAVVPATGLIQTLMSAQPQSAIEPPGGGSAPTQTEFNAFADAMSTSYGAPVELVSIDPYNNQQTELADTSVTNLLAELPVLETQANGANLGLQLADGTQVAFANTGRLATFLYSVAVQQMRATQFVTDNYNLDMQWLSNVDQPLLDEADYWSERSAAEASTNKEASIEDNVQAYLAMQIAAEAPGSRQDQEETIKNAATGNPTQISVWYSGDGSKIHDVATPISQYIEVGISTAVNLAALATGQAYLYYAAAAIDAAQAGQDFSNGQDLAGILSAAKALSAGITGGAGAPTVGVALTTAQTTAAVINAAALGVGGVYGIVQSAQNGNALGIAAGAFEAAAGAAAGIGLVPGIDDQTVTTLSQVAVALGQTGLVTNMASDFSSGHLGQGLIDSLNLYLPELAGAYQNWVNGSGPATQGATSSTVPAQKISLALTQDGDLPLVALAVAESELMNGPIPNGTELTRQDAAVLEAQFASSEGSTVSEFLAVDATVMFTGDGELLADGPADGSETAPANTMTITLPAVESNSGLINPSFTLSSPNPNTVLVAGPGAPTGASTAGPGSQNNIPTMIVTPDNSGYNLNTSGNSATSGTQPSNGSGGSDQSGSGGGAGSTSTLPDDGSGSSGGASATSDTVTVNFGNSISQALMAFIPTPAAVQAPSPTTPAQLANQAKAQAALNDPKVWAFLQAITWAEGGGYNQLFKYPGQINSTFADMSTHPPAVVYNGSHYSAARAYMIEIGLWADLSVQLGLYDFTASTQNLMAAQELIDKNFVGLIDKGDITDAAAALTGVWAALPNAGNQSHITPQQFQSTYSTFLNAH